METVERRFMKTDCHQPPGEYNRVVKDLSCGKLLRKWRDLLNYRVIRGQLLRLDAPFGGDFLSGGFGEIAGAVIEFHVLFAQLGINYLNTDGAI